MTKITIEPYKGPSGGWGSAESVGEILWREGVPPASTTHQLVRQNKANGFACVSCGWAKPANAHPLEFCENGAKATAWELTSRRTGPDFFARHSVTELLGWSDYALEQQGRLTHPMRYDPVDDRYHPVEWDTAFAEIAAELKALDPNSVVFYASGRASLETSYMYSLLARMYGTNNLPDSSNMCHETTSVALKSRIGVPVGTVVLDDFEHCDAIFFFGQNVGSNSPRLLHPLQEARRRGCEIVTFNPLKERGLERFTNPQSPIDMLRRSETQISTQYHQVKAGGDIAAMVGMCKYLIEADDKLREDGKPALLDHAFIAEHCHGYEEFATAMRGHRWRDITAEAGLSRADIQAAAQVYARAERVIGVYGMGLTQHMLGVHNVEMIVNLLLLRGNIGREGAGVCPVRGHSNVQGQRTVGISEKPELVPLDKLAEQYAFAPPRTKGVNTVEACQGIIDGSLRGFIGLGGNFVRAVPETEKMEAAWAKLRLTVQIATKLNRNHLIKGEVSYVLPCIGRIEKDMQAGGAQSVSIEDSTSCIHGSFGERAPASDHLLSEAAIVSGIATALLPPNPKLPWAKWVGDYALIRDAIEETYPQYFKDFNARMFEPGGFYRGNAARERDFQTKSGKAEFAAPPKLSATGFADADGLFRLMTLRSNDQFNTTIYGYSDRFRGIEGTRDIVFVNPRDMKRLGLTDGEIVGLRTDYGDDVRREVSGLRVVPYEIPEGCLGAYYPECNPLIPVTHHAELSFVPAAKSVPVRVVRSAAGAPPR